VPQRLCCLFERAANDCKRVSIGGAITSVTTPHNGL
jgi:hypothetical protein